MRILLAALGIATAAYAAPPAGTVTQSSGLLFAQGADGHAKILAERSTIGAGTRLVSGKTAYARIDFGAKDHVILGPGTELAIDGSEFTLIQGAVQVSGGGVVKTPLGTISGADATYIVTYSPVDAAKVAMGTSVMLAELSPGLQATRSDAPPVQIAQLTTPVPGAKGPRPLRAGARDGMIHLTNGGGSQSFTAGQFGYTASFIQPPVVLPANPGMQFTPPPSFSSSTAANPGSSGSKAGTVDCEVR